MELQGLELALAFQSGFRPFVLAELIYTRVLLQLNILITINNNYKWVLFIWSLYKVQLQFSLWKLLEGNHLTPEASI